MSSTVSSRASALFQASQRQWLQAPTWAKLATLLAIPSAGILTASFLSDYGAWKAMGPGGLPDNFAGYIIQLLMRLVSKRDTRSVKPYEEPEKYVSGWRGASEWERALAMTSFIDGPVPQRKGAPTRALPYIAPHRERFAGEYQVPKIKEAYLPTIKQLHADNSSQTELRTSGLERRGEAIFLVQSISPPKSSEKTSREIAHLHESDLSAHVVLSLADAKQVIAKGWGERHGLSGVAMPMGYTMLYVPRTMEEVDLMTRILKAGVAYMRSNETS